MIRNLLLSCVLLLLVQYQCFAQRDVTYSTYSGQSVITAPGSITFTNGFHVTAGSTFRAYITLPSVTPVPSADQNYIMRAKVKVPGITSESALNSILNDKSKVEVTVQYFDGLGRSSQFVQQQGSPSGNDVIQPVIYDSLGRETKQYLPYVATSTADGAYRGSAISDQQSFYNSPPAGVVSIPSGSGQVAYSQTQFEASPLNRVLQQGFAGGDWKIGSGHTQGHGYGINGANEVRIWRVTSNGATGTTYFPKARLYTDTLTDEDGYKTVTYTDDEKKIRLKKVQDVSGYLSTYYVYDDLNNLRYVLPPGFTATSFTESDTAFDQYVYGYHYNGKRQVIEKKIPGKGWDYMVYNKIDLLVMSQDANQRAKAPQEWTIFKYDELSRLVLSGIYSHTGSSAGISYRSAQQGAVDGNSNLWETSLTTGTGYTANTYPASWDRTLTINYFDTYVIPGKTSTYDATQTVRSNVQGLSTGSKVNILGTSDMLLTVNYYDEEERLIESISDNHLGGTDRIVNTWSFSDELTASTRTHTSGSGSMTIVNNYEYDHMGRKTRTSEKIGSDTEVSLAELGYNELGQVYTKSQAGGKQTTTYSYNSRGWLTGKSAPLFAMQLKYNDGTVPRYNGNITNQLWGTPGSLSNTFSYSYDPLSRLTSGDTGTGTYEKDIAYDGMGNITSLNRNGTGTQSYSYSGNRLSSVTGGISRSYSYDANGNALTDGTNTLTYNLLNLPSTVSGGASITYTYDALGRKLRSVNGGITRDYISGIQYTGGAIDFIQTEEGLARKSGSSYLYEYNLTDHLGNNRLSFDIYSNAAREIQHDSYYPFGKTYNSYTLGTRNNYLYNGKELQDGLGHYDYGARFYDPVIGRWNVIDAKSELYKNITPYAYAANTPVNAIDPDGHLIIFINGFTAFDRSIAGNQWYWREYADYTRMVRPPQQWMDPGSWRTERVQTGRAFDLEVSKQLGDNHRMYVDGQVGYLEGFRSSNGRTKGYNDAPAIIESLHRTNGVIDETIKIITHSMGGVYGGGYLEGVKEYLNDHPDLRKQVSITLIADFDPFEAHSIINDGSIKKQQFMHKGNGPFTKLGWLANQKEQGKFNFYFNEKGPVDHGIMSFFNDIKSLQEGTYIWNGVTNQWNLQN